MRGQYFCSTIQLLIDTSQLGNAYKIAKNNGKTFALTKKHFLK